MKDRRSHPASQAPFPSQALLSTGAVLFALALLVLVFFRHIALSNRILAGVDALTYFYPYRAYVAQAIRSGQIPLWNPYLFMGAPALANPQAAVFYPLNLALSWLSAPKMVAWSIVLHVALAAFLAYFYARHAARLSPVAALTGACTFALGGFMSGQIEHVNQLNVSAWFPLLLLLWELRARARWPALLGLGATIGIGLLAGHTQSSYISIAGLGTYACAPLVPQIGQALRKRTAWKQVFGSLLGTLAQLGLVSAIGAGVAAVQLVPTAELARLSIRSAGLSYREAVAFSLKPLPHLLRYTFLPPWGHNLADLFGGDFYTEYLAYVGVLPLLLALLAAFTWLLRARTPGRSMLHEEEFRDPTGKLIALAGLGVFLALGGYNPFYLVLYKVVPGFGLFRVPARWLFLYAFGAAMLAGTGLQQAVAWLRTRSPALPLARAWKGMPGGVGGLLTAVSLIELFAAAQILPFNYPTAPEAFSSLRTAPAHILAAQQVAAAQPATGASGRFLSMSDMAFDPGDRAEIEQMFRGILSDKEIYDYIVSIKRQEILAPNLPLAWKIYSVDGYDGGVLPLARYVQLERLFLDDSAILTDGRLREGLKRIPPSRLLSILGVRYVITDKVHDVWIDDVFYDLALDAVLGQDASPSIATEAVPDLAATSLGIVSYLEGAQEVVDGTPVAEIRLTTSEGEVKTFLLRAGQDSAEGLYVEGVRHSQARVGHHWRDLPEGNDYVTQVHWEKAAQIERIEVTALPFGGRIHIRGLALIDTRDGSNVPLLLSTDGSYRQVHSGDVKVYEVMDALPRAYVVHHTQILDDEQALAAMRDPAFDPAGTAILASGQEIHEAAPGEAEVRFTQYEPEEVTIQASLQTPGYLILSDSWYPGWQATLDGQPAPIERADLAFRGVYVSAGTHTVQFRYVPKSYFAGTGVSLLTLLGIIAAWTAYRRIRTSKIKRNSGD
jgi:hypothetical protein